MLKVRIIPILLLKGNSLVKSVNFSDHRIVGDAMSAVKVFSRRFADEMVVLDLDAREKGSINIELLKRISAECNMPLTFGGGIDSMEKADQAFFCGADKIIINSSLHKNPQLISKIASKYGSQAVVISIDVKNEQDNFIPYHSNGEIKSDLTLKETISLAHDLGAGEILANDIDNDGVMKGFNMKFVLELRDKIDLPLIIAGGCSNITDFKKAFDVGVEAVAAASIFHWIGESIITIKKALHEDDIAVRML